MLGANNLRHPASQVAVEEAFIHRSYSRESGLNNIALVMLVNSVTYTDRVRPICILRNATLQNGPEIVQTFSTFGWGFGTGRRISNTLVEVAIKRFNQIYCGRDPEQSTFCGGPSLESTCGGDIGGPLSKYVTLQNQEMQPVQLGIVSIGLQKCGGVRYYTDVTSYADWIERFIRAYDEPREFQESQDAPIQAAESQPTEETRLYEDCGEAYLTANIYGPDFMAKGVMITHRFVLTTASNLTVDVSFLRVGVEGFGHFQEMAIDLVYHHPEIYKTDLALLKLSSELIPENVMKPICILRGPSMEQSRPQLTVLDVERNETGLTSTFKTVLPVERQRCSANLRKTIQSTEICIPTPQRLKQVFGIRGNVVSQKVVIPGNNAPIHSLYGIVKYSKRGLNVITNVAPHTNWIATILNENSE
ncbi:hypothetical protein KR059_004193 [Drosophila kikkawai]|nr:hypothetical protein KR059_004193 [Drosophila kikkawai]